MAEVFLSLGSNIHERLENLKEAVKRISLLNGISILRISSVYETEPIGYRDQNNFYNIAVKLETTLSPKALLFALLEIEKDMGRVRTIINGPRIIDIDLLLYENEIACGETLTLPHPRMMERAFVLAPLVEICDCKKYADALSLMDIKGVQKTNYKI